MKITAIETHVCNARMRNWVFVKVLTDQPGLCGWGEATLEWHTRAVVGAIEDLGRLLVGEDPTRIEHLWQMMFRQHFWHGNGIVRATAISGIDIALWDILGKVHGVPCHKLWGGPVRDYVRLYGHLGGGKMEDFYETDEPAALRRAGGRDGGAGLHRVQVHGRAGDDADRGPCADPVRRALRAAMREAVGDDIDIMVDCHARPCPRMGHLFAKALEPFDLYWFEEPCWPERVDDIAEIQRAVLTPIATGERLVGSTRSAICSRSAPAASSSPTSPTAAASPRRGASPRWPRPTASPSRRTTRKARSAPPPRSSSASRRRPTSSARRSPRRALARTRSRRSRIRRRKGMLARATDKPGLGIEIDLEAVAKHPFEQEIPQRVFYADGSVGDW